MFWNDLFTLSKFDVLGKLGKTHQLERPVRNIFMVWFQGCESWRLWDVWGPIPMMRDYKP